MKDKIELQLAGIEEQMRVMSEEHRNAFNALAKKQADLPDALRYAEGVTPEVQLILEDANKPTE